MELWTCKDIITLILVLISGKVLPQITLPSRVVDY